MTQYNSVNNIVDEKLLKFKDLHVGDLCIIANIESEAILKLGPIYCGTTEVSNAFVFSGHGKFKKVDPDTIVVLISKADVLYEI